MAYLNGKSANNSQNTNNNQSVELNIETVEQLRRLLNLLADLNLVDLTEESINSQEHIDFPETEVHQTENNNNLIHQNITKYPEPNQQNITDFTEELIEESINSEFHQTENNNNSIYQSITEELEANQQNITDFTEELIEESINSEFHQTENNNNSIYQSITEELKANQQNITDFTEELIEESINSEFNQTENNNNSIYQSITEELEANQQNITDFTEELIEESINSEFHQTENNDDLIHQNITKYPEPNPQNITDFTEELIEESINSEFHQTENNDDLIHQNITKYPEPNPQNITDFTEELIEESINSEFHQTENNDDLIHQNITKYPEPNQQNITNFTEELIEESINSEFHQTENNNNSIHQSITEEPEQNQQNITDFTEHLIEESINSQEHIDFPETEVHQTKNNDNLIHQNITEEPEANQNNIIDVEGKYTKNQAERLDIEKPLLVPQKFSELSGNNQEYDAELEAFETLQNILFGSQLARLIRRLNTSQGLQIFNSNQDELNNVLTPLFSENLHLGQTEAEVIETIAPVIDQAIQKRFRQDQQAITSSLAPLLAPSIETQIKQDPQVIAEAIAPIIDIIITKKTEEDQQAITSSLAPLLAPSIETQIKQDPQVIAEAIAPIIDIIITKKTEEDQQAITSSLAPLLAPSIETQIKQDPQVIAEAIAPIIDIIITKKTEEDQQAITSSLAPLLAPSIETQIKQDPQVIAEAIAPIIDIIITKKTEEDQQAITSSLAPLLAPSIETQIKQDPQVIAEAIAPIIDIIITKKTEEDQQAISEVLAPLLPVAISAAIQNYPQEIAKALGPEMGAAIREQIRIDRRQISQALAPEMGRAIKDQITLEQNSIVDALYPVIGSTISKYMAEAIREINYKISDTFSFKGIRRKIQAAFQGVSEAELIISEVMIFTVQAVFLIHKESGLVISEAQHSGRDRLESEMLAGMLTAIQSFVNDCIAQSGDIYELNEIEYGDSKIILEVAGYCYLAVVIRGQTNKSFIKELRQTLSNIVIDYGKYIKSFAGDPDTIPRSIQLLLKALIDIENVQENQKLQTSKSPTALLIVCGLISSLIFIPWVIDQYYSRLDRGIEARTSEALSNTPELAIYRIGAKVEQGSLILTGKLPNKNLLNKATKIAQKEASLYNLEVDNQIATVRTPQDASEISDEVDRITRVLNQMEGVSISTEYGKGRVTVKGTVMDMADSQIIIRKIEQVPGVTSVISTTKLSPLKLKTRIYFDLGSAQLQPVYIETMAQIQEFLTQYPQKHLRIVGHTDRTGNPDINEELAIERANTVRDALVKQGVDARRLEVIGQINSPQDVEYNQPLLLSRCVTFDLFEPSEKDN